MAAETAEQTGGVALNARLIKVTSHFKNVTKSIKCLFNFLGKVPEIEKTLAKTSYF